jgi:hypothetical protein
MPGPALRQGKLTAMPTVSMFYGIIIRMYYAPGEHRPPHFHAYYGEYRATLRTPHAIQPLR